MDAVILTVLVVNSLGTIVIGTVSTSLYLWKIRISHIFPKESQELEGIRTWLEWGFFFNCLTLGVSFVGAFSYFSIV